MTEDDNKPPSGPRESDPGSSKMRELMRGALEAKGSAPDLLGGVQKKLRQRSRGKFYGDRWSTTNQPPIQTYLVTSLLMLAVLAIAYAVLSPLSGEAKVTPMTPAPVRVVPLPR
jgi:hypothetical protein